MLWFVVARLLAALAAVTLLALGGGCALVVHTDGPGVRELAKFAGFVCLALFVIAMLAAVVREAGGKK